MQEQLIIYLHNSTHPDWVVLDAEQVCKHKAHHGDPTELSALAVDKEVIVIVPAEDVLLTSVQLPDMKRSRLAQALPYLLEEQLISDVEALHFVPIKKQADGSRPVAIVAQAKMQAWISLLQTWGIEADKLVPASLALPNTGNVWQVAIHHTASIRMGAYDGLGCDENNLADMLEIAIHAAETKPESIHVHHFAAGKGAITINNAANIKQYQHKPEDLCPELAKNLFNSPTMNLLQGAFRTTKPVYPQLRKMGKMAAYLAASWALVLFLYPTLSYLLLTQKMHGIDNQINALYQRHFPIANNMTTPQAQIEAKLRNSTQTQDDKFLFLLGYVGKGKSTVPNIKIKRMEFDYPRLKLDLTAVSEADITAFKNFLSQQGLKPQQQQNTLSIT